MPMFDRMAAAPHQESVKTCSRAAAGDATTALAASWVVALAVCCHGWVVVPTPSRVLGFTVCDLAITIAIERLALGGLLDTGLVVLASHAGRTRFRSRAVAAGPVAGYAAAADLVAAVHVEHL